MPLAVSHQIAGTHLTLGPFCPADIVHRLPVELISVIAALFAELVQLSLEHGRRVQAAKLAEERVWLDS